MKTYLVIAAVSAFTALSAHAQSNTMGNDTDTGANTTDTGDTMGRTAGTNAKTGNGEVSDANIAAILHTANQAEIAAGKKAEKTTRNPEVKSFAKQMVMDHEQMDKQANQLLKKLKVKPEENELSKSMKKQSDDAESSMKKLKGAEFDKSYVDNQVQMHQQVLATIDSTLLPNAQNPMLKDMITQARTKIATHLDHARDLQQKLGGAGMGVSGSGTDQNQNPGSDQ